MFKKNTLSGKHKFPFHETDKTNDLKMMYKIWSYFMKRGYPIRENYDYTKWMQHIYIYDY